MNKQELINTHVCNVFDQLHFDYGSIDDKTWNNLKTDVSEGLQQTLEHQQLDEPSEAKECENIAKTANSFHCSECNYGFDGWGVSSFKLCPNCDAKIKRGGE